LSRLITKVTNSRLHRSLLGALVVSVVLLGALWAGCHGCADDEYPPTRPHPKGVIILGFDGMDPLVLKKCFEMGITPRMKAMAEKGTFVPLGTSTPPQSPVAWSNFITGMRPEKHGIHDFIHRDLDNMSPYLSTSRALPPKYKIQISNWVLPLSAGRLELLRKGRPFWEYLTDKSIPATIIKMPSHFPPKTKGRAEVLSGMGTPDLMGTYGTFQLWSDDPKWVDKKLQGGITHPLRFGDGQHANTSLAGPPDPMDARHLSLKIAAEVIRDKKKTVLLIRLGETELLLAEGEWSEWVDVSFSPGLLAGSIDGMVRFYAKSVHPHTTIYISPINIDPLSPTMPISSPPSFSKELAGRVGRFYTQGMAEDTKAFEADVFSDKEFLALAGQILEKRTKILKSELNRFQGGLLFVYFSSTDQVSHMFWRTLDLDSEEKTPTAENPIFQLYSQMDAITGYVLDSLGSDTELIIMSDHGFAHCRKNFQLNTWLAQQGYLVPKKKLPKNAKSPMDYVDWSKTQAYGMGLNGLYINQKGREPEGVVPFSQRRTLLKRISRHLRNTKDPENGQQIVTRTFIRPSKGRDHHGPDMIVGYNRGYKCGSESATGNLTDRVLEVNTDKWRGDHSMDPDLVPGVFLSTRRMTRQKPMLEDIGPTVLRFFNVTPPEDMVGKDLFNQDEKE